MSNCDLIDPNAATCLRCGGVASMLDTICDTLEEHTREWVCSECMAVGTITLRMTVRKVREFVAERPKVLRHRALIGADQ